MTTADDVIKLRELVGDADVAMVTTETPTGELHSRPLALGAVDDDGALRFAVDGTAAWVSGLRQGDPANVSITDDKHALWISIAGSASVSEDRAMVDRIWNDTVGRFLPHEKDAPQVRVLTVHTKAAEYWDAPASRLAKLAVAAGSLLGQPDRSGESNSIELS